MLNYENALAELLQTLPYELDAQSKQQKLLPLFKFLHSHHQEHCEAYRRITSNVEIEDISRLSDIPYLAVRLFKLYELSSIAPEDIFKVVYSSGTSGQSPSRIFLDRGTSALQSKTLVKILQSYLGKQRLPMLVVDTPSVLKKDGSYSARAAGIQGLSMFSRETCFVLDDNMGLNVESLREFAHRHQNQPVLIFGFTFMVWRYLLKELERQNLTVNFNDGILMHSGGWKKLEAEKVSNDDFKQVVAKQLGVNKVHNFYGMAEQTGTIFVECEEGYLHTPNMAEVIVHSPETLEVANPGQPGLIQVMSVLSKSYPGYSLLTEDIGRVHGEDDCHCGRKGKYFSVLGRLPKTEVRGCSDTHTQ